MGVLDRLAHAWNAFKDQEDKIWAPSYPIGGGYGSRPDRPRLRFSNERSIISSIYTRIAMDCAAIEIKHVRLDDEERYLETINSGLNSCLNLEANIDQAARAFKQDMTMSLLDEGSVAIVAVDTTLNPEMTGGYDVQTLRVGRVVSWYPRKVTVSLYNDIKGVREEVTLDKKNVAIIENPLYSVMNEPNSTLQRLIRKLNLLDGVDEQVSSGKLDLIIQLPYVIKSEARRQQAETRRKDIEMQLKGSTYGIAYTDGTEKITQLNRPAENNLLKQIEQLTEQLYAQLGLTSAVFDGTADEKTMVNYYNRTVEPILAAQAEAMKRVFLTKTARSQGQSIEFYRDPFKLITVADMAEIADKFIRNEVMTPNELRSAFGQKPSTDPKADELRNPNMPQADEPPPGSEPSNI